ncbi:MAG: hypothetical protein DLM50_02980 [Candidatus Meridianibacter frigidus]|nr:MAG: hypothetical protein DLM50_02980 [Candidatus Eremiobacteraeota bacterium]
MAEHSAFNNQQFTLAYPPGGTNPQILLGPASLPPNGSCFGDMTAAENTGTQNLMFFAVYKLCGTQGFSAIIPIDSNFQNRYAYYNSDGRLVYKTMIYTPDSVVSPTSGWDVLLWNPNTSTWELVTTAAGTSHFNSGLSVWMTFFNPGPCSGGSASIVADHLALVDPTNPSGSELLAPTMAHTTTSIVGTGSECFTNDSTGPFSDQFILARPNNYWRVARNLNPQLTGCTTVPGIAGFYPCDLQRAYKLPSNTNGVGQVVAIVDAFDDPTAEADLHVYRAQFGLPTCTTANGCFKKVNQAGNPSPLPSPNAGWAEEISLDLDMASAVCPNCHILLVEGNSNSFTDLAASVDTAAAFPAPFNPTAISNSYGALEFNDPVELSHNASYAHPGIAITVSSGDGSYDSGPQWPAAIPTVIAVGGTSLYPLNTVPHNAYENAWDAAGSGCSIVEPKPAWQTDTGCTKRTIADVSAVADPLTGVAVYDTTPNIHWAVFGGTSVSSPIIASASTVSMAAEVIAASIALHSSTQILHICSMWSAAAIPAAPTQLVRTWGRRTRAHLPAISALQ